MSAPSPLPENAHLAFTGELAWQPARISGKQATQLQTVPNSCGRPNADVVRRRLGVDHGEPIESWQIDFPEHFTLQETALYEAPFDRLQRHAPDWKNPHLNPDLRRALARVSRYLAMPVDAQIPDWLWIEDDLLPDASLLVVARDDDFTHGILQSEPFAIWYDAHRGQIDPVPVVASFPFPWAPNTPLHALTAAQEELRHAIARAVRSGSPTTLHDAVANAYGWPLDLSVREAKDRLNALHDARVR